MRDENADEIELARTIAHDAIDYLLTMLPREWCAVVMVISEDDLVMKTIVPESRDLDVAAFLHGVAETIEGDPESETAEYREAPTKQ